LEEEDNEDEELDIRNMTESEMQSYYSMKALKKVYVKPALPLRRAKNTSLKDYKIVKLLGQGGFGQVHLVKSLKENKQLMALKRIMLFLGTGSPNMAEQKRLRVMRETQIMETMKHPHIVTMHAHFIDSEVFETVN
jgi:serine/threonine protein kinase